MTPGKYNIICPQGATFSKTLTWKIDDVPVNLTGYTARMQAKDKHKSTCAPILNVTTENGGITLGGSAGTIDILISAEETSVFYAKEYVYDLELVTDDIVYRIIEGKFIVTPEVTT
jgi:hypothetical protein